jgi:tetratricopeptide (TPR) repeat protein
LQNRGSGDERGRSLHLRARIYSAKADYRSSIQYFNEAERKLNQSSRNRGELCLIALNRATVYELLSNFADAEKDLKKARNLITDDKNQKVILLQLEGKIAFRAKQNYIEALKKFKVHREQGKYSRAIEYYQQAQVFGLPVGFERLLIVFGCLVELPQVEGNTPKTAQTPGQSFCALDLRRNIHSLLIIISSFSVITENTVD